MTHRQFVTWQYWLRASYNEPSRTDWYLMALACEVRRVMRKNPNEIQPKQFRLEFKDEKLKVSTPESREAHQKAVTAMAKARWGMFLGAFSAKKDNERN